jgi:1-acyl-sn-glycerol-3-phosphate acyltransferase
MKTTIFNTPIITPFFRFMTKIILRLTGWQVEGQLPALPKFIIIGAPHTSNWDFLLFLAVVFTLRVKVRYFGKAELFRPPFGFLFYWCGGIPVDRSKSVGLVEQVVNAIKVSQEFILVIAPEGTRGQVGSWKSGFYHIARGAEIPIIPAYVDGRRKTIGIGEAFTLTGALETDMQTIQAFFAKYEGVKPKGVQ